MRAWLCMNPMDLNSPWGKLAVPKDIEAVLIVYRTKKAAYAAHDKDVELVPVNIPKEFTRAQSS